MIIDKIENAYRYKGLSKYFAAAFEDLASKDISTLEPGKRYEIGDTGMGYNLQHVECKAPDDEMYEAHKVFADIQFVAEGTEYIGYADISNLELREDFKEGADICWYRGKGTMLKLEAGTFAVFFPEDAHMPCRNDGVSDCSSRKLVIKVPLTK